MGDGLTAQNLRLGFAGLLFLFSGISALLYQVSWQRILGIFSGMHIYSITMIVTAFMAGLGFGNFFGGRWADRLPPATATRAFAGCELFIGLFALASPWLYYDVAYLRLGFLVRTPIVLPTVHLALLIVPTFLMGASLPLLCRGLVRSTAQAARSIGILYGLNTLGAALGAWGAVWYLIGAFGFVGTIRVGVAFNFAAALGAWFLARAMTDEQVSVDALSAPAPASGPPPTRPLPGEPGLSLKIWALIYGVSGFIALSLELLWFRVLDVTIKSSPYTFGHLLGGFLLFLAVGSLFGAWAVRRSGQSERIFFWGQWGITVSAGIALLVLCRLPLGIWPMGELMQSWHAGGGLHLPEMLRALANPSLTESKTVLSLAWKTYGLVPLFLFGVPTFLMGATFAFIQKSVQTDLDGIGWRVGLIQTANIVGSIGGSFLTGTLFLQWFGTAATFRLLILLGVGFGILGALRSTRTVTTRWLAGAAVLTVSLGLAWAVPSQTAFWARFHGSHPNAVVVAEDASSVVAIQLLQHRQAVLRVNGTGHSRLPYGGVHTLLGVVPVLLHSQPTDILLIGLGAGNTAWAAASAPEMERMDLYEIAEPEYIAVQQYRDRWFDFPALDQLLNNPRVHFRFSDGRLALRSEPRLYDVIEADALEPSMAYSGNLYSEEFFASAARRLKPGGMLVSYTPTERTRRTMLRVFPYVLYFHGPGLPSFMVGSLEPVNFDEARIRERLQSPPFQAYFEASGMAAAVSGDLGHFLNAVQVEALSGDVRRSRAEGEINTDLYPRDEYDPWLEP